MKKSIAILLLLALLVLGCALAETKQLAVTGSGTVYIQADRVRVTLGVNMQGEDLTELQQRANQAIIGICDALQAAGLDEKSISTNYLYINPIHDYSDGTERMVGYSINSTLSISTGDMDNIGTYIDAAFLAGANTFNSLDFFVDDSSEVEKQALALAVKNAMGKAETIAEAAGCKVKGILEIQEAQSQDYYSNTRAGSKMMAESMAADAAAGTTVRAAQINVSADVQIIFELEAE